MTHNITIWYAESYMLISAWALTPPAMMKPLQRSDGIPPKIPWSTPTDLLCSLLRARYLGFQSLPQHPPGKQHCRGRAPVMDSLLDQGLAEASKGLWAHFCAMNMWTFLEGAIRILVMAGEVEKLTSRLYIVLSILQIFSYHVYIIFTIFGAWSELYTLSTGRSFTTKLYLSHISKVYSLQMEKVNG